LLQILEQDRYGLPKELPDIHNEEKFDSCKILSEGQIDADGDTMSSVAKGKNY